MKINSVDSKPLTPKGNDEISNDLYNILPIAIYSCDKAGYITSFNKAAEDLWGRKPEIGKDLWCGSWKMFDLNGEPISLGSCPMAIAIKKGLLSEGNEIIIQRPNGVMVNVLSYPVPILDNEGNVISAVSTLVDITEQKASELKSAMLASIIESSEDAIVSKTLDGIITSWNVAAEKMFGYKEEEVIGKSIKIVIPTKRLQEEDLILSKIRNNEPVNHYETFRLTKTGVEIPVSLSVSPIKTKNGKIIGAAKIARNISDKKIAEVKLNRYFENQTILNSIGKVVSENLDIEDILQKVTDATTKLTGAAIGAFFYNKLDKTGDSYMLYTFSGASKEAFERFGMLRNSTVFNTAFSGKGILRVHDITKDPRYGNSTPDYGIPQNHPPVVSFLSLPVISKSGEVIGSMFYGHPEAGKFTQEHEDLLIGVVSQTATALDNAKLYEEIKNLNAKKDEFIGLASHELKTPVTSLSGYLQIVHHGLLEGDRNKGFIQKALQQINKLSRLISDLLDVSKIEAGKLPLAISEFDIYQLAKEVIDIMQYSNKSHQLILTSELSCLMVFADKQRIEQVIINLISNAIKYSANADVVKIAVSINDKKAILSVQDFGIGISKSKQAQIFSRFYRVDDIASHITGLGIGLYISKEIISHHQGKLSFESEAGKGSIFKFEIPIDPSIS